MPINAKSKFTTRPAIAVDVDGTLFVRGRVNTALVEWLVARKAEGAELLLWSARGRSYAQHAAEAAQIAELFDHIAAKPGYIVDDKGWAWTRYTKRIRMGEGGKALQNSSTPLSPETENRAKSPDKPETRDEKEQRGGA